MLVDQMHYNFYLELDRVASNDRPDLMPWEVDEYLNKAISLFVKQRFNFQESVKRGFESDTKRIADLASLHIKSPELQPMLVPTHLGNGNYEVRLDDLGRGISGQFFRYLFVTSIKARIRKDDCVKTIDTIAWQIDDTKTWFNCPSWKWRRIHTNFGKSSVSTPPVTPTSNDTPNFTMDLTSGSGASQMNINEQLTSVYFDTTNKLGQQEFELIGAYINYIKRPNRVFLGTYNHIDGQSTSSSEPIHCDVDDAFHDEIIRLAVNLAAQDIQDPGGIQVGAKKVQDDFLF